MGEVIYFPCTNKTNMNEEQLIEILHRVSNDDRYVILLNGNTVSIIGDSVWLLNEEGCDFYHNLNTLNIVRNHGHCICILLDRSEYELEITMKQNINNL